MGDWQNRAAFWRGLPADPAATVLDALSDGPPVRCFFQRMAIAERVSTPATVVRAVELEVPRERGAAALELRRALLPRLHALPGFVFQHLYRDLDAPGRLLSVHGWADVPTLTAGHRALVEWLGADDPTRHTVAAVFQGWARVCLSRGTDGREPRVIERAAG